MSILFSTKSYQVVVAPALQENMGNEYNVVNIETGVVEARGTALPYAVMWCRQLEDGLDKALNPKEEGPKTDELPFPQ
jgi:hypothetical protein